MTPLLHEELLASDFAGTLEQALRSYVLDKLVSLDLAAALCNMSQFHFSRSFKRICGVTFSDYLLEVRIKKAVELLSRPRATVTGACYEVGFRDPSYFGRIFKRYAGITPSEYRDRWVKKRSQQAASGEIEDDSTMVLEAELALRQRR